MLLTCRYVTKDSNNTLLASSRKHTQMNYCNDGSDMKSPFHHKQQLSLLQCNSRCSSCCNINSSNNGSNHSNNKFLTSQKEILGMLDSNSNNKVGSGSSIKRSISQKIQRMQNEVSCRSIFNRNEYDNNTKRYQSVDKKKDDLTMKGIIRSRITRMLNKDRGNYFDKRNVNVNVNVSYKHRFMFHQQSSMHKYNTRSQFLYSFNNNNNSKQQQPVIYPKKYYNGKLINDTKPKPNAYQLLFNNNNNTTSTSPATTNTNNNANTTNNTSTSNLRLNLINLSNI